MRTPHPHTHDHARARSGNRRRLTLTLLLVSCYMIVEFVGGLIANSLALLADAGHMLSDSGALVLTLFALWLAERPPTAKRTYGYYRAEILAALANGAVLIAASIYILVEAFHRLHSPPEVMSTTMLAVATGGFLVNVASLWILQGGQNENLNIRGAWLHVLTDALGSVGAIVAGILIAGFGWHRADPAISALIGLLVMYSAWRLVAEATSVLMENAPRGINVDAVLRAMEEVPEVLNVHDLHVWTITSGLDSLSAHVIVEKQQSHGRVLDAVRRMLRARFGIDHITIQIEPPDFEEHRPTI